MVRKLALLLVLCLIASATARADVNEKYLKAAREFLEREPRVNDMIRVMHMGTAPISGTCNKVLYIVYSKGKSVSGHFSIEMRYKWRGPITRDGETDVQFSFDENGRLYDLEVVRTNGYAFLVTPALLEVGKLAVKSAARGGKNEEGIVELANSIKTVRELQLLKLQLEQATGK